MFLYLFSRFLFHPKLLLTDLRSEYSGYFALIAAFTAIATLNLGSIVVSNAHSDPVIWLLSSIIQLVIFILLAMFYLPVIHLICEKNMPGSRVSDLLVYSGFALSPFYLSLPIALIVALSGISSFVYYLFIFALFIKVIINLILGIKDNYQFQTVNAIMAFLAPVFFLCVIPMAVLLLSLILVVYCS